MDPKSITERIYEQADEELRQSLKAIFHPVGRAITDGSCKPVKVRGAYIQGTENSTKLYEVDGHEAIAALESLAFQMKRDENRRLKLDEFMHKVNNMSNELEELRGMIPQ